MKPLRVLSIDWDFLVNATTHQRAVMFPDGGNENLSKEIQNIIWLSLYVSSKNLSSIGVDFEALKIIKGLIKDYVPKDTPTMIADSHSHIYNFIMSHYFNKYLEIVNFDFHHDCYSHNNSGSIDCGNWVNHLFDWKEELIKTADFVPSTYYWVKRKDSDTEILEKKSWFNIVSLKDLQEIVKNSFDLLFICRSSMWSPPHLDGEFIKFCNGLDMTNCIIEEDLKTSRYNHKFKTSIKQQELLLGMIRKDDKNE